MGAIFLLLFIFLILSLITGIPFWIFIILGVVAVVIYLYWDKKMEKQILKEGRISLEQKREPYKEYSNKYDSLLNKYKKSDYYFNDDTQHYSITDNILHIVSNKREIYSLSIEDMKKEIYEIKYNIDDIKYYKLEGSIYEQQHITGGGGGGSSLKGAVVGGIIAGDAGAIIGSRKKVDEITTTYKTKDDRRLELTFKDDTTTTLSYKYYEKLLDYIPEKEYDNYIENMKLKGRKK